jgi:cytosine/adenosine deaminase-related metal-dependent hydrolase
MATTLLLRNATVLIHSDDDHVTPHANTDILIKDDLIAEVGSKLSAPSDAKVLDCTGKIITPGFIDTHHHLWQTQLKGRHADEQLLEYMVSPPLPTKLDRMSHQLLYELNSPLASPPPQH